ncbi:hypothetical protein ZEAMMB73_Zm00001d025209 [Zea mays]|jgi:hypothetical protein|uniref:Uncharacterized protein n=1 Tax=Zea mays TaxID=4577 RepID=A0A1D6J5J4_MAIZE|nr:hypothetical protein ZEAMMB73_Zm00001d025209 [Zea mays]
MRKKETAFAETEEHRAPRTQKNPMDGLSMHTDVGTAPTDVGTSGQEPQSWQRKSMGNPKGKEEAEEEEAAKSWLAWECRVAYPLMSCLACLSDLGRSAAANAGSGRCCHHEALELLLRSIAISHEWGDGRTGDRDDGAGVCQCAPAPRTVVVYRLRRACMCRSARVQCRAGSARELSLLLAEGGASYLMIGACRNGWLLVVEHGRMAVR